MPGSEGTPTGGRDGRRCVLVLGGGFAGIHAVRALAHADAEVVLVDRHDYHTFQPLLYQVATGIIDSTVVAHSLRDLVHDQDNARIHTAEVTAIDLEAREVRCDRLDPLTYDYLVLALGAEANFFGTAGAPEHGFPMYTLPDALRLKEHVLGRWEAADADPSLAADGALSVVVVGGGPTGVETSGAFGEVYRAGFTNGYPTLPHGEAKITLVEAGPELFSMFKPELRAYARGALEERSVEVVTGDAVASVTPTRVTLASGRLVEAHTLVWGAGLQANRLVASLGLELQHGNRIGVGADLTVPGHPEVYALGDVAAITDPETGQVLPQLGSVAQQAGKYAGGAIARLLAGKQPKPFGYRDKGTMATIGRGAAVVQTMRGRTIEGRRAQAAWLSVHAALLPTREDRRKAMIDWAGAGLTHWHSGAIITRPEGR